LIFWVIAGSLILKTEGHFALPFTTLLIHGGNEVQERHHHGELFLLALFLSLATLVQTRTVFGIGMATMVEEQIQFASPPRQMLQTDLPEMELTVFAAR
jgi:hypothetical protein